MGYWYPHISHVFEQAGGSGLRIKLRNLAVLDE
jgi:hypothetical protein